jgi:hypothetical protein
MKEGERGGGEEVRGNEERREEENMRGEMKGAGRTGCINMSGEERTERL